MESSVHLDYVSLAVALGIGFAIGLQRAQSAAAESSVDPSNGPSNGPSSGKPTGHLGGIRTFPLVALTGAVAGIVGRTYGAWILVAGAVSVMALVAIAYAHDVATRDRRGLTTETAILLTYLLGVLTVTPVAFDGAKERWLLAATIGIAATAILSLKQPLHDIAARISQEDLLAWIKFAVVAIVIVPLLPDRAFGPSAQLQVINPQKLGTMIVLIAAIGLVGYVSMRMLGPNRGLGITGLVGGLVSSTAVTLALSSRSKREEAVQDACALGVILANTIMPLRVLIVVTLIDRQLAGYLAPPMLAMSLTGAVFAFLASRRSQPQFSNEISNENSNGNSVNLANPFELGPAIKFGLLYGAILLLTRLAEIHLGDTGLYVAGLIAGVTDIDAITLSVAQLAGVGGTALTTASATILLAAASNTLFKASIALSTGSPVFRARVGLAFGVMVVAAVVALAITHGSNG